MKYLLLLSILVTVFGCKKQPTNLYLGVPVDEIENTLEAHLKQWFPATIDTVNGGYYTNFEYDWTRSDDQKKMLVTQARNLWTSSRAFQLYPENTNFKKAADHGYQFITSKMWDRAEGGFHLNFDPDSQGAPTPYKLIYANAFVLYALAEYAKINPSTEVKTWIEKTFSWMDEVAHDDENLGYFNIMLSAAIKNQPEVCEKIIANIGWGQLKWKGQNTSIHLLEAFTNCYQVLPNAQIKNRLEEMLYLVRDSMVQEDGSLKLYFESNWHPINHSDSSRVYILKNIFTDHVSFGHNIETAYLIVDAAATLYGTVDSKTLKVAKRLTDHTLQFGFDTNYYGLFDKGYVFGNKMEIVGRNKTWWSQVEALHTLALMDRYFPDKKAYTTGFQHMWKYINNELWDEEYGGFYNNGVDVSPKDRNQRKAHNWKGPYHDGRALMQLWLYANKD